jgi:tetratricopeptide (TPR) repeat protein
MYIPSPSTLHSPDLPEWHDEPHCSPSVAISLRDAYRYVHGHPNDLAAAYKGFAIAISHVGENMCLQQRMNLHYILAQCAREMGEPGMAYEMLDRALQYAAQLYDRRATAELLAISGNTRRGYMQPRVALGDLRESRAMIDNLKGIDVPIEPHLELSVVFAIAGVAFFQARYEEVLPLLDEAHSIHHESRNPDVERDRIAWMRAVNLRYLGRSDEALPIFLDIAERARDRGEDRVMRKLLSIAQTHAIEGMKRSDAEFDQGGGMLARLAIVRQSQFVEDSNTRRDIIAAVWRFAENSDEPDVMARVRIALAREYMKQGDVSAAHNLLRQVTGRSAASEVLCTSEPAKALLRRIGAYADW